MADDFDVEAMLEAPYRKVGLKHILSMPLLLLYMCVRFYPEKLFSLNVVV